MNFAGVLLWCFCGLCGVGMVFVGVGIVVLWIACKLLLFCVENLIFRFELCQAVLDDYSCQVC